MSILTGICIGFALISGIENAAVETPWEVRIGSPADVDRIEAAGGMVDAVRGDTAVVYLSPALAQAFRAAGWAIAPIEVSPEAKVDSAYHDYAEVQAALESAAAGHTDLCRLYSLGQSEQGRDLWALLITDNPDIEEDEPEFRYVSTIHGDEPVGTELCLYLIARLLDDYGSDDAITRLVDDTEIWIVPLMNPDGLKLGRRANAFGHDLNRSFPTYGDAFTGNLFEDGVPDMDDYPAEVQRVMAWTIENSFTLGANLHTGSLVVNYPYDYVPGVASGSAAIAPDNALFRELSLRYARLNTPMYNSFWFANGVTNGSAWYSITGGFQDWGLRFTGSFEVTVELSDTKKPSASQLANLWDNNEAAMLAYLESVHLGVRGLVSDRETGAPLRARVLVEDNSQPVFTDPDVGDYHRLLLPGAYRLTVDAPGYIPFRADATAAEPATRLDVALSDGDVNGDGVINAVDLQLAVNAVLEIPGPYDADVDGLGASATDIQQIVRRLVESAAG